MEKFESDSSLIMSIFVSRFQGKIAPWIAASRACAWFENKRFDWPSVSFSSTIFLSINLISSFCTQFQLFALFVINRHALSQSARWNFCMYIITNEMNSHLFWLSWLDRQPAMSVHPLFPVPEYIVITYHTSLLSWLLVRLPIGSYFMNSRGRVLSLVLVIM